MLNALCGKWLAGNGNDVTFGDSSTENDRFIIDGDSAGVYQDICFTTRNTQLQGQVFIKACRWLACHCAICRRLVMAVLAATELLAAGRDRLLRFAAAFPQILCRMMVLLARELW